MLGLRLVGTLLALLILAGPAGATERTFVGGGGGNWNIGANWNPVGVPTGSDDVTLPTAPTIDSAVTARSANIQAGILFYSGGVLTLTAGTSIWAGGAINMHNAAQINVGGIFDVRGDSVSNLVGDAGGAPGPIQWNILAGGTLTRTQGTGTASFGAPIVNQGTVSVASGTLTVRGVTGADQTGTFAPLAGGILALREMSVKTSISGPGALRVDAGLPVRVDPLAIFDVGPLNLNGGPLEIQGVGHADSLSGNGLNQGTGELIVDGPSTLGNGIGFKAGKTTFMDDVAINSDIYPGCGSTLRLEGTTTWNGGFIDQHNAAIIENAGTFIPAAAGLELRTGDAGCANGPIEFRNLPSGVFSRPSGTSVKIASRFVNDGTVNVSSGNMIVGQNSVQNGGTWNMFAGTLSSSGTFTVAGGTLRSSGTIAVPVTQTGGVIAPGSSPGLTTIDGDFAQQAAGTLEIEIAGTDPALFDRLQVNGSTSLAGKLQIVTLSPFDPALADTFQIISSGGSLTGTFSELLGAQLSGKRYYASYGPQSAVLALAAGPVNNGKPSITPATARPGDTLTCQPGSWTGAPTFAYKWRRNGVEVATGLTYPVTAGDVGQSILCRVTATNAGGSADADSDPLVPLPLAPQSTGTPVITPGTATAGDQLTCDPGAWTGTPAFTYAWERDGQPIDGAAGTTYLTVAGDAGKAIACAVTGTNAGGATTARSAAVTPAAKPVTPAATPTPTPTPTPAPVVEPAVIRPAEVFTLPSTKKCVSRRNFRIRIRQPKNVKLVSVTVLVNGKKVKANKGSRVTAPVDLRGLPKGRFKVEIRAVTSTGRTIKDRRTYRTCAPKK